MKAARNKLGQFTSRKRRNPSKRVPMFGGEDTRPVFGHGSAAKKKKAASEAKAIEREMQKGYRGGSLFRSGQGERLGMFDDDRGGQGTMFNPPRQRKRRR